MRSGAVKSLLAALSDGTAAALVSAVADAVANCALAPANHARLAEHGAISKALWVCCAFSYLFECPIYEQAFFWHLSQSVYWICDPRCKSGGNACNPRVMPPSVQL